MFTFTRHFSMPDLTDYARANDIGDIDETKTPAIAKDDRGMKKILTKV